MSSALRNQAREFTAVAGLPVSIEVVGEERTLPPATSAALYRIAQEALANVFRHAQATSVSVKLEFCSASVQLEVRDDGHGFPADSVAGRGVRNMQQRATDLWGTATIEPLTPRGTIVRASLPANEA
jgi:protein-histidine pros-kinase